MEFPEHIAKSLKLANNNSVDLKTSEILANNEPMLNGLKNLPLEAIGLKSNGKQGTPSLGTEDDDSDSESSGDESLSSTPLQIDTHKDAASAETDKNPATGQAVESGAPQESEVSDGESFEGKIVYNPDGSAYIIDETDCTLDGTESVEVPQQEGCIIDHKGVVNSQIPAYPQIASAVYIHRNPTYYNPAVLPANSTTSNAPIMHSYKVFDVKSKQEDRATPEIKLPSLASLAPPLRPILMCFICKLSFTYTKSFTTHAVSEHSMTLTSEEKDILSDDSTSAIIQAIGSDKLPLVSFLEPHTVNTDDQEEKSSSCNEALSPGSLPNESQGFQQVSRRDALKSATSPVPSSPMAMSLPSPGSGMTLMQRQAFNFTRGMCEDHPQGKQQGVECPKCDMVLSSTRSLGGHMTMMHSRNSCKTLKCPKCNWHYKYQETLEIHMKEKHPDTETQCVYCLANQPHPRLARGESYQCGYKPYRCEICNYSTTTKGNLSIHMQSDKHINNVQDLQNSGGSPSDHIKMPGHQMSQPPPQSPTPEVTALESSSSNVKPTAIAQRQDQKVKQKPSWRCDVCNYETNVARNLRIHMTSEKHTHNMLVLQQNVKHMQRDMQLQMNQMALFGQDPGQLIGLPSPLTPTGLTSFPYDPSMFMTPMPSLESPMDLTKDGGESGSQDSQPPVPVDVKLIANEPTKIFHCAVCNAYSTNLLDELNAHMQKDRSLQRDPEHVMIAGGNYVCNLCTYKTNLKANFQLHCKTDKHVQRLQLVNHIQEGGPSNEWRLKYVNLSNPVQLRCSACDYYTNTIHKLQVHEQGPKHELSSQLFLFLQRQEANVQSESKYYYCSLCGLATRTKLNLIQHVRSSKHLRKVSVWQMQQREQGKHDAADTFAFDFFKVKEYADDDIIKFDEQDDEIAEDTTNLSPKGHHDEDSTGADTHPQNRSGHVVSQNSTQSTCPLCQECFTEKDGLQKHLFSSHKVTAEGMQRLLVMVETDPIAEGTNKTQSPSNKGLASSPLLTPDSDSESRVKEEAMNVDNEAEEGMSEVSDEQYRCQMCTKTFLSIDSLYAHQNELGHLELKQTPRGPGYLCWKKGCNQYFKTADSLQTHFREIHAKRQQMAVSERHVYKYRCSQCSLAFKTVEKLQMHSQYHVIRAATKCNICERSFRSLPALHRHYEATHFETMTEAEIEQVRAMMLGPSPCDSLGSAENVEDSVEDIDDVKVAKDEDSHSQESTDGSSVDQSETTYKEKQFLEDYMNSQAMAEDNFNDPARKYKCHRCKVAFTKQNYLSAHNRTLLHRKGEKLSYPMEKYLDPNRPYKCDTCKESFTQKNILLVHFNSVSHLHKQRQVSLLASNTCSPSPTPSNSNPITTSITSPSTFVPAAAQSPDAKPYKCHICKVAYAQSTTLDIHMRSVLHQSRASKIQELASTGQIDLSQPLIEHPTKMMASAITMAEQQKKSTPLSLAMQLTQHQQSKPIAPSSSAPSVISASRTATTSSDSGTPVCTSVLSSSVDAQLQAFQKMQTTSAMHVCNRCNSVFVSAEVLQQHQQLYCLFSAPGVPAARLPRYLSSRKLQVQKNLLENFGFECVMQYNELNQALLEERRKRKREAAEDEEKEEKSVEKVDEKEVDTSIPEMNKCVCPICHKKFTSIWVLKCHREEVHNDVVPPSIVENYSHIVAEDINKKFITMDEDREQDTVRQEKTNKLSIATSQSSETATEPRSEPATPATPTSASFDAAAAQMLQMSMLGIMPMFYPPNMQMAMNLQSPMFPMMLPPVSPAPFPSPSLSTADSKPLTNQHQPPVQQSQQQSSASSGEKRARTRINDEQLKILRAHFDINNSPSEEQIISMSEQSGLPQKVIKHWFRNTLFKERQRNKDSPYNFDNPPSTSIDLEEYQKTGKLPPIEEDERTEEEKQQQIQQPVIKKEKLESTSGPVDDDLNEDSNMSLTSSAANSLPPTPTAPFSPYGSYTNFPSTSTPVSGASDVLESHAFMARSMRRANRTRFTDFQIKTLQDYFDQNAYPKDDDLEHLSKLLGLNPRVIVVWFQNARQKARKVYENQPPENGDGSRYTRTQSLNYQCKKCATVFQRYYDLIKHQKKTCYQNEDIPLPFKLEEDSGSSVGSEGNNEKNDIKETSPSQDQSMDDGPSNEIKAEKEKSGEKMQAYCCDRCHYTFSRYDLWVEHQKVHSMNPGLFPNLAPDGAFALLQNVAKSAAGGETATEQNSPTKRPLSGSDEDDFDRSDESMHKRLRTTILPEQLDFLYQKYQQDSNPTRKQLEKISDEVGLKKRVVQVWFQNTRARERKGQFRAHTQLIHKRCPFCRALFRNRSALESHLAMKHPEEMAKGAVDIDSIPDASQEEGSSSSPTAPPSIPGLSPGAMGLDMNKLMAAQYAMQPFLPFIPPMPSMNDPVQAQLKKIYEDSLKKYLEELSGTGRMDVPKSKQVNKPAASASSEKQIETPLDLSKPIRVKTEIEEGHMEGPKTDISERSVDDLNSSRTSYEDSRSEINSEDGDSMMNSSPTSPSSAHRLPPKRYRTQMTNVQIKIMKHIFQDYKTPTMAECELLGKEIGLQKRVVQVWFQNARAKEKKAKLAYQKTYGTEPESPRPPEECTLCKFPYSHRYTIQDHVFTQKHVSAVRKYLSNNDIDCVSPHDTVIARQLETSRSQKDWEQPSLSSHPHLAQLRAMGLQAASDASLSRKKDNTEPPAKKESKTEARSHGKKEPNPDSLSNPQLMSPFGGFFPGMDPSAMAMLPFMYPSMPGMYPGVGLPFMQPGLFPGAETMFPYDPTTFGTPLTLLQIPQQAIRDVGLRLADPDSTNAQYTQDSKSLSELKTAVSEKDYKCAAENTVDVGYVCKKCTMVFPVREACVSHQKIQCFIGKSTVPVEKCMVKLEQIQYKCSACSESFNTLQEYKLHCSSDVHKSRVTKHNGHCSGEQEAEEPPAKKVKSE